MGLKKGTTEGQRHKGIFQKFRGKVDHGLSAETFQSGESGAWGNGNLERGIEGKGGERKAQS